MLESLFFRNNKGLLFIILINDDNDKVIIGNVCFLGAKHCAWCSTCFVSFNPHTVLGSRSVQTYPCFTDEKTEAQGDPALISEPESLGGKKRDSISQ